MKKLVCVAAFLLWPSFAFAASSEDCEKIKNAFEYNNCLANIGPQARERRVRDSQAKPARSYSVRRSGKRYRSARNKADLPRNSAAFDIITRE